MYNYQTITTIKFQICSFSNNLGKKYSNCWSLQNYWLLCFWSIYGGGTPLGNELLLLIMNKTGNITGSKVELFFKCTLIMITSLIFGNLCLILFKSSSKRNIVFLFKHWNKLQLYKEFVVI